MNNNQYNKGQEENKESRPLFDEIKPLVNQINEVFEKYNIKEGIVVLFSGGKLSIQIDYDLFTQILAQRGK